ncbi:MAG: ubiquinone/menaquinone biosynthesis methyltransferase [Candidatus Omnitrophica bacterium]|nr:ubiquinone/menaquinone biosynthesis methyltransferase [Candidatus Omnitrophota bacterium]
MKKTEGFIKDLFDRISPRYDLFNTASTFFLDRYWRKCASRTVEKEDAKILDVCTGTGELALQFAARLNGKGQVVGVDFSKGMLELARKKLKRLGKEEKILLLMGQAEHLSFQEGVFDYVTSGFSMRNLIDLDQGLREMVRVLKSGGHAVILEINRPSNHVSGLFYRCYLKGVVPIIGFLTCGRLYPFLYLNNSVIGFQTPAEFCGRLRSAGFRQVSFRALPPGAIGLYDAVK